MSTYAHLEGTDLPNFDELWNYGKPDETEKKFREILPRAQAEGSKDYQAQLLTQIARTRGLQGDFPGSHKILDDVELMLDEDMKVARARYLLERGRAFNSDNQPHMSRPLFLEAWEVSLDARADFHAIDAAHMMGIVEEEGAKMPWNLKAVEVAEGSKDERARGWLNSLYNNIGWTYFAEERWDDALGAFRKNADLAKELGRDRWNQIARWSVAKTYRMQGRLEDALGIQEQLDREYEEAGAERTGYTYEELGECLLALGREDEAKKYFALAYGRLSKDRWLPKEEPERLARLKELGGVEGD